MKMEVQSGTLGIIAQPEKISQPWALPVALSSSLTTASVSWPQLPRCKNVPSPSASRGASRCGNPPIN